jgi:CheY-like chemotaxis protein
MCTKQKILLVEDSDTQAEMLKHVLENSGYNVVVAYNGEEGYQLFLQQKPNLIISDILMPGMDGYELCEKIRTGSFYPDIPIILLTELSQPEDVIKGLKYGADNFIKKPYNAQQLLFRIKDILDTKHFRQSITTQEGINFCFNGEKYYINAEKQQILDLLISTFESAIQQNKELAIKTEQLQKFEQNYRALIENLPNPVLVITDEAELLYSNPAAQKLFSNKLQPSLPKFNQIIRSKKTNHNLQLNDADDNEITVEVFKSQIKWFDRFGWLLSINNITKHKHIEASLQEAARLKSTFLANISHELRTPLNGIIGMTNLTLDSKLDSTQKKNLEIVKQCSESLLNIINDILDYSKLESGNQSFSFTSFNLHDLINQSFDFIKVSASQKNIKLAYYIDPKIPQFLEGDYIKLRQILINFLGNSVKFTSEGEINLIVEIDALVDDKVVLQFSVIDSGIGIPAKHQPLIFMPFAQADNSLQRQYGGTGLGLSICKEIVTRMGGSIAVESPVSDKFRTGALTDNPGSRFYFSVPLKILDLELDILPEKIVSEFNKKYTVYLSNINGVMQRYYLDWFKHYQTSVYNIASPEEYLSKIANDNRNPVLFLYQDTDSISNEWLKITSKNQNKNPIILVSSPIGLLNKNNEYDSQLHILTSPTPITVIYNTAVGQNTNLEKCVRDLKNNNQRHSHPLKILVVEDNAVNQKVAQKILEKLGHHVTIACNGKEAVEIFQTQEFDVVLMDIQMPVMDGLEATKQIRQLEANKRHTQIFALTAHVMDTEIARCKQAGMDDHVSKPLNFYELEEKLNGVMVAER